MRSKLISYYFGQDLGSKKKLKTMKKLDSKVRGYNREAIKELERMIARGDTETHVYASVDMASKDNPKQCSGTIAIVVPNSGKTAEVRVKTHFSYPRLGSKKDPKEKARVEALATIAGIAEAKSIFPGIRDVTLSDRLAYDLVNDCRATWPSSKKEHSCYMSKIGALDCFGGLGVMHLPRSGNYAYTYLMKELKTTKTNGTTKN